MAAIAAIPPAAIHGPRRAAFPVALGEEDIMVGAAFTVHRAAATAGAEEGKMCLLRTRQATLFVPQSSLIFP
jgi:hypothetical protein